jgi:hypothetical protein
MTTRRESILAALATTLNGVAGATAYRSRVEPFSRNQSPAVIVEPVSDQADVPDVVGRINWRMTVRVTVFVRANVPDQASDSIVQSLYSLILTDPTIGGRALDTKPVSVNFEMLEADVPAGIVTNDFEVLYQTSCSDMSTL